MPRVTGRKKYNTGRTLAVTLVLLAAAAACGVILYQNAPALAAKVMGTVESQLWGKPEPSSAPSEAPPPSAPQPSSDAPASPTGMFKDSWRLAQVHMEKMTLEQKVGQVFIFRCRPTGAVKAVDDYQPGGYCLMGDFFKDKTAEQVQKTLAGYQKSSKTPMALCADEEGGTVLRISRFAALAPAPFGSPQEVFARGGMEAVKADTLEKAALLQSLGLNMNLAPVCDVSTDKKDFIYARSFGKNADATAQFVATSVEAYQSVKLSSTLKHFPGYGDNDDTHEGIAYDERSYSSLAKSDFVPFQAGIRAGAPCVLLSHNVVKAIDPVNPASLSPKVVELLRETLGFTGVVMTDDLSMQGVMDFTKGKSPCVLAFNAGVDILLSTDFNVDYEAVLAAVKKGEITKERLEESVTRVLAWKYSMGII